MDPELLDLLKKMKTNMDGFYTSLSIEDKKKEMIELQNEMNESGFWDSQERSKAVVMKVKSIKVVIDSWDAIQNQLDDCEEMIELNQEDADEELYNDIAADIKRIKDEFESFELQTLLSKPNDKGSAILELHAGAGGTESCDWASILLRMYLRWAERNGFKTEIIDQTNGEEAGVRSVSIEITGEYVYGYLKAEKGVHRLVRISPFDANKKRHTSFASADVTPVYDDIPEIEINPADLKIDTYRASGAGGQHVNTTDSAVRITHVPSGVIVQCQSQRSQHKNRDKAMVLLKNKLYDEEEEKRRKETQESYEGKTDNAWGNQIRSYVLHPYQMIKDHRTNFEIGNVEPVLDGELSGFIEAYLRKSTKTESN